MENGLPHNVRTNLWVCPTEETCIVHIEVQTEQ